MRNSWKIRFFEPRKCNYSCKFCFHTAKSSFFLPETEEGMMESKECLRRLKMAGGIKWDQTNKKTRDRERERERERKTIQTA